MMGLHAIIAMQGRSIVMGSNHVNAVVQPSQMLLYANSFKDSSRSYNAQSNSYQSDSCRSINPVSDIQRQVLHPVGEVYVDRSSCSLLFSRSYIDLRFQSITYMLAASGALFQTALNEEEEDPPYNAFAESGANTTAIASEGDLKIRSILQTRVEEIAQMLAFQRQLHTGPPRTSNTQSI
jgi:hypothetical protein